MSSRCAIVFATTFIACGDDPPPTRTCVSASYDAACTPAYEPTYDAIYANTFQPSCAKSGVSCHGRDGRQGGLNFEDRDEVYGALRARSVVPGEPQCSDLVRRIEAASGNVRMPPGRSLPEGDRCAISRWIAAGAPR